MNSALPVGARVGNRPFATEETFMPTGNFAGKSVTKGFADSRFDSGNATARLRPRYRDYRSAAGDGHRA